MSVAGRAMNKIKLLALILLVCMGGMRAVSVGAENTAKTEQKQTTEAETEQTQATESEESETQESETQEPETAEPESEKSTESRTEEELKVNPDIDPKRVADIIFDKTGGGYLKHTPAAALQRKYKLSKNQGKILLAGGSSIRRWKNAPSKFAPLKTVNMGIGGSTSNDWLKWYRKLIVDYHPEAVVLYVGGNDFSSKKVKGKNVARRCQKLLTRLMNELPDTRIYYIGVYPSINRKPYWKQINVLNKKMKQFCRGYANLRYIDISSGFYKNGKYQKNLLAADGLHLSEKGYQLWNRAVVKKVKAGVKH